MEENKKIRVLVVFGAIANGGVEKIISSIYQNIRESEIVTEAVYHKGGLNINQVSTLQKLWPNIEEAPEFITLNWHSYRNWWKEYIKRHQHFDIIHVNYIDSAFCYIDLFNKDGAITVGHSHNPKSRPFSLGRMVSDIISYPSRFLFKYFIACSKQTAIECFGSKIAESDKYFTLLNGISIPDFEFNEHIRNSIRQLNGISSDKIIIGHVGRFSTQKNQKFAVKIFNEYKKLNNNSELWFLGEGEQIAEVKDMVKHLNLEDSIKFFGVVDNVNEYMQAFDYFLFPSTYEGLGIVLMEAQVSGLPCFISDRIPEEADIHANLIERLSLEDAPFAWAKKIADYKPAKRISCGKEATEAGFNINNTKDYLLSHFTEMLKVNTK